MAGLAAWEQQLLVALSAPEASKIILWQKLLVLTPHHIKALLEPKGHLWLTGQMLTIGVFLLKTQMSLFRLAPF